MSKFLNKLIARGLLLGSLVLAAYINYIKVPSFHEWVDTTFPIIKAQGIHLLSQGNPSPTPVPAEVSAPQPTPAAATTPIPATVAEATPATTPQKASENTIVDLAQLSQSRAEWPKTVVLKSTVDFPAVLDGKVVGTVKAPAGTQVLLIVIKDGKAGVEFNGGGAMLDASATDLTEQVLAHRHAANK